MKLRQDNPRMPAEKKLPTAKERAVLDAQPALDMQAIICIGAWEVLNADRPYALRLMPVPKAAPTLVEFRGEIPSRAVVQYARDEGLSREAARLLVEVIAYLDAERTREQNNEMRRRAAR